MILTPVKLSKRKTRKRRRMLNRWKTVYHHPKILERFREIRSTVDILGIQVLDNSSINPDVLQEMLGPKYTVEYIGSDLHIRKLKCST